MALAFNIPLHTTLQENTKELEENTKELEEKTKEQEEKTKEQEGKTAKKAEEEEKQAQQNLLLAATLDTQAWEGLTRWPIRVARQYYDSMHTTRQTSSSAHRVTDNANHRT